MRGGNGGDTLNRWFNPSHMAQAIMDPEEVRRFAKELKRFNEEVQARASALQARFAAVGSVC